MQFYIRINLVILLAIANVDELCLFLFSITLIFWPCASNRCPFLFSLAHDKYFRFVFFLIFSPLSLDNYYEIRFPNKILLIFSRFAALGSDWINNFTNKLSTISIQSSKHLAKQVQFVYFPCFFYRLSLYTFCWIAKANNLKNKIERNIFPLTINWMPTKLPKKILASF